MAELALGGGNDAVAPHVDWDPLSEDALTDPIATHARLRADCPVAYSARWGGFWALTKYQDILSATTDTVTFISSDKVTIPRITADSAPARPPLESDRPEHTQYRRLMGSFFSPGFLDRQRQAIATIAEDLLDRALELNPVDMMSALTIPYPANVLCSFLGLPPSDWAAIRNWSGDAISAARASDSDALARANEGMYSYVNAVVADRRVWPRDPRSDLVSALLAGNVNGEPLADSRVADVLRLMLSAGHGTTTNSLGSCIAYLAAHPDLQNRLRSRPDQLSSAIDELLRMFTPIQVMGRTAARDVEIRGRAIRKGDRVALMFLSGNRDDEVFTNPNDFDEARTAKHIGFGHGIHKCLGMPLARMELQVALAALLRRTKEFGLVEGPGAPLLWPSFGPSVLLVEH